jgi:hypothetical protein
MHPSFAESPRLIISPFYRSAAFLYPRSTTRFFTPPCYSPTSPTPCFPLHSTPPSFHALLTCHLSTQLSSHPFRSTRNDPLARSNEGTRGRTLGSPTSNQSLPNPFGKSLSLSHTFDPIFAFSRLPFDPKRCRFTVKPPKTPFSFITPPMRKILVLCCTSFSSASTGRAVASLGGKS